MFFFFHLFFFDKATTRSIVICFLLSHRDIQSKFSHVLKMIVVLLVTDFYNYLTHLHFYIFFFYFHVTHKVRGTESIVCYFFSNLLVITRRFAITG